ncbi:MAG: cytochrome C oxidase subunit II, partial [Sulfobacillus benefaciens]
VNPMVRVQCAEVCGPGHPWMEAPLKVVSHAQFASWIKHQQALAGS